MGNAACSDDEFIRLFKELGSPTLISKRLGVNVRNINQRRLNLERKYGIDIEVRSLNPAYRMKVSANKARIDLPVTNGTVIIASDCHYQPGPAPTAHRALVRRISELKPLAVILDGDVFDGASNSRHSPIGWEKNPTVQEEIEACQERLAEIEQAFPSALHIWPGGNHDMRFETYLAGNAPQYANVHGMHLKDHFPNWTVCWYVMINDDVEVRHRMAGGVHATYNNTLKNGTSVVTGHLHAAQITRYTDRRGTRYGVDNGMIAERDGQQFLDYTEARATNWREGFTELTFIDGKLMPPALVEVLDDGSVWVTNGQRITV